MRRSFQILIVISAGAILLHIFVYLRKSRSVISAVAPFQAHSAVFNDTLRPSNITLPKDLAPGNPHQHHPYKFILNQPDICQGGRELIIVCITAVQNFQERQAVRETWGSYAYTPANNASLIFLLGLTNSSLLQKKLVKENQRHKDIVQEDFVDSYRNLSLKSVALLKWVTVYCNASRFVLKADDDMYINIPNLVTAMKIEALKQDSFIMGHMFEGVKPVQDKKSKWYTPLEHFSETLYPMYTSGTAYCMTTTAALQLYRASVYVPVFWLEDVYVTGLVARKAAVKRVHNNKFNYVNKGMNGCFFRRCISGHRYSAEAIRDVHRQVHDVNLKCGL